MIYRAVTESIDEVRNMKTNNYPNINRAKKVFHEYGGILRTAQVLNAGIHSRTLYKMRDKEIIEKISRGVYRLADMPPLTNPDFVTVALRVPEGVICLISALAYHELTTEIPHQVYVALPRGTEPPRIEFPPIRIFWFKGAAFTEGIEERKIDGVTVRIYCAEKTIADCLKYRNKIGTDVALEALKEYCKQKRRSIDRLMKFAQICRVEKIMRPYLEALI